MSLLVSSRMLRRLTKPQQLQVLCQCMRASRRLDISRAVCTSSSTVGKSNVALTEIVTEQHFLHQLVDRVVRNSESIVREDKYLALFRAFHREHHHLNIDNSFRVPSEPAVWPVEYVRFKLGNLSLKLRSRGEQACKDRYPRLHSALQEMQFDWTLKSTKRGIEENMIILRTHYQKHGHWKVRSKRNQSTNEQAEFEDAVVYHVINKLRYRSEQYLKKHCPDYHQELTDMGFLWKPQSVLKSTISKHLAALQHFHGLYHTLQVPSDFVVPNDDPAWPAQYAGQKLGLVTVRIRGNGKEFYSERDKDLVAQLDSMDFSWKVNTRARLHYKKDFLQLCKEKFGDDLSVVDKNFVVSKYDTTWPQHYRGVAVGKMMTLLQHQGGSALPRRPALARVKTEVEEDWLPVLDKYYELHRNLDVKCRYITPESWPNELHNKQLGSFVSNIRQRGEGFCLKHHPRLYEALKKRGFKWKVVNRITTFQDRVALLKRFHELFGHVKVANRFVIPANDERWPVEYGNYRLGEMVYHARKRGRDYYMVQYPKECQELDSLGFAWVRSA